MNCQVIYFCELIRNVIHPNENFQLQEEVDWEYMVKLAKEHNIFPLLVEEAVRYNSYVQRPDYATEMKEVLSIVNAQTKRTKAFLKLYKAFSEEGIYPIVMKGVICRELYGKWCDHRPSGDEDILVSPAVYWKAKEVLINNGYVPTIDGETEAQIENIQEISFINSVEKLHIELHLNPMGTENKALSCMSDYFKKVFECYREIEICGVKVCTMSHQEHILFLILHAFKHFMGGGIGIRQVLDILLYQEQYNAEIDLERLNETLHYFKADLFWNDIIHIGNEYFGFMLPLMTTPNFSRELLEDIIQKGIFGNQTRDEANVARVTTFAIGDFLTDKPNNWVIMTMRIFFPSKNYLLGQAPYLNKMPWLLPVAWIKRWGRFIKKNQKSKENLTISSFKISQKRMWLLKKYDLL